MPTAGHRGTPMLGDSGLWSAYKSCAHLALVLAAYPVTKVHEEGLSRVATEVGVVLGVFRKQ